MLVLLSIECVSVSNLRGIQSQKEKDQQYSRITGLLFWNFRSTCWRKHLVGACDLVLPKFIENPSNQIRIQDLGLVDLQTVRIEVLRWNTLTICEIFCHGIAN